ncbi:MAG: adenylyltransferase/cytidyltransferase family protein [Parachlamydiaceae bacterium]|nr:adenylyltransferase/cytidyltransferase family protein [Parachlamydiaceae bacterium]
MFIILLLTHVELVIFMKLNRQIIIFVLLTCVSIIIYFAYSYVVQTKKMVGVYWGAFDPPTKAHEAIITAAFRDIPIKKLIVVVNNHSYKKYTFPLEMRIQWMKEIIESNELKKVELLYQDDMCKIDFLALREMISEPICGIAGYDAYMTWIQYSNAQDRALYDAIAVIPRGDEDPTLFDEKAFILPISPIFKHVSSSAVREFLKLDTTRL